MLRDDLLIRQIRKLVQGLLQAARLRREKDAARAEHTLDDILAGELGLSSAMVRALTGETLLDLLSPGGELDRERALTLGLVLAERARASLAKGAPREADATRAKARTLLEAAEAADVQALLDDERALERYARELEER